MTAKEQKKAAAEFAAKWADKGYEKGECQKFWRGLLHDVFEVADPDDWLQYEVPVATGFVDAYISRTKVLIEQKGFEHGLADKAAMKQAMMYVGAMPDTMPVRYVVLSNFQEFWIYDKHSPEMKPVKVQLKDLPKKLRVLSFLTEVQQSVVQVRDVAAVDKKAGELVGRLYQALLKSYSGELDEHTLASLNMLCVRLVFCAYAEDSGVFPKRDQFVNYMRRYDAEAFRDRLAQLFRMLNTDYQFRDPDDIPALLEFPYVGSGLFDDEHIRIPRFTDETRTLLLDCMCADLDWTEINPTIFGAVFESTLSTVLRRKNGMHYTTVKNIHRVADPLFLESLEMEFGKIATIDNLKKRNEALKSYQEKLGALKILDPACGSGNFLTETYLSLRRLENRAIELRQQGQSEFDLGDVIRVSIDQFYGIEIDGFAVSVAQTALWIAESQMMIETEKILHRRIDYLPLKRYAHIMQGNALRMDWGELLGTGGRLKVEGGTEEGSFSSVQPSTSNLQPASFDYILGNPPFVGKKEQSKEQKSDMLATFVDEKGKPLKTAGKIDYVSAWYWKACEYCLQADSKTSMAEGRARTPAAPHCAFVSTNSICQGEQVAAVWKPLRDRFGVEIDFAWRTFVWDSEANEKAHVHVVIVGFSVGGDVLGAPQSQPDESALNCDCGRTVHQPLLRRLYDDDGSYVEARHINGYLMDGTDVFIDSRAKPLCDVPLMNYGSMPIDSGHLILSGDDRAALLAESPNCAPYVRRYMGGEELLNNRERWCLWLKGAAPNLLRGSAIIQNRVRETEAFRRASDRAQTKALADMPMLFGEIRQPDTTMLVIPKVSSEKRRYIPVAFVSPEVIVNGSALIVPDADKYAFGVMASSAHNAWMRCVAGRLELRYQYSKDIVYNSFPWPDGFRNESQRLTYVAEIEKAAQAILDARALYPDSSLADLYDDAFMPPELRKAHKANDAAVLAAYGFPPDLPESDIVARLFAMYARLTEEAHR